MSMADRDGWIWYDGKMVPWREATTHVLTHTLHYGMGVFEGVRCYKTVDGPAIFRLRDHTNRLFNSAHIYGMKIPFTQGRDRRRADSPACAQNKLDSCYIRPIAFYGSHAMGVAAKSNPVLVAIGAWPWGAYLGAEAIEKGIRVKTSSFTHHHPNITMCNAKAVGNYTVSILANQEALHDGYEEAMLLDPAGLRVPGLGRERVHRPRRRAVDAGPRQRRAQRHHARLDHHVRARARHSGAGAAHHRATRCTSPTRRSSPARQRR